MKTYLLSTIAFITIAYIGNSCTSEDPAEENTFNTSINISLPLANSKYMVGDTIQIKAQIYSDISIHGYEILLHKNNLPAHPLKSKHTHGKVIDIDDIWVVDVSEKMMVSIEIVALIDHNGNKLSEKTKISCND